MQQPVNQFSGSARSGAAAVEDEGDRDDRDDRDAVEHRTEALAHLCERVRLLCLAWHSQVTQIAATCDLSRSQLVAFTVVATHGPVTMGQIGDRTDLPTSSLTALVDRLGELDLVRRETHPTDRRAILVRLTDAGAELASRIAAATRTSGAAIATGIETATIERFTADLDQMLEGFARHAALTGQPVSSLLSGPGRGDQPRWPAPPRG